ncbi:MAG: hypothetical protein ACLPQS_06990 [Acidimicrobiales bacterium]
MERDETENEKGTDTSATTRRAILLGGAVGLAGLVAESVISAQPAGATEGQNVLLGKDNAGATARTGVFYQDNTVLGVLADGVNNYGLQGQDDSTSGGVGVVGQSTNGIGVSGTITNSTSIHPAVLGSTNGSGCGVYGESTKAGGTGAKGQGTHGATGVYGQSDTGTGVAATSTSGDALHVVGRVVFSQSGLSMVAANKKSVKVTAADITTSSIVLATLQTKAGAIAVANAVPASGSFTINLTAAHSSPVKVAWFVIG